MSELLRARTILAGCVTALALAACGGGGDSSAPPPPVGSTPIIPDPLTPAPPVPTSNIAVDGREWLNARRSQAGLPALAHSSIIDIAAQGHSDYQRINNTISHEQTPGREGFTGATLKDRLVAANYVLIRPYAYGEVISAANSNSGQYMAEELITAIYHRFVIFEPKFREIGTGAATASNGRSYFTANFGATKGLETGLAQGQVAIWPADAQASVPRNFFSDTEMPDPVPDRNEVGYPISVHANINASVIVQTFTVRSRNGGNLESLLVTNANEKEPVPTAVAIVPLSPLAANTTYDVTFAGTVDGSAVSRNWSFTTAR